MVSFFFLNSSHMLLCVNNMVCIIRVCVPVYATTAANPDESSYACYYDEARDTYLGDWYSVNWMEDSDVVSSTRIWDRGPNLRKREKHLFCNA